jgi:hypothetical protein
MMSRDIQARLSLVLPVDARREGFLARPRERASRTRIEFYSLARAEGDSESKGFPMSEPLKTTNHEVIRAWIEARQGRPAVARTAAKGAMLRVDFGDQEDDLEPIEWEEFFTILDDNELAFVHQDITAEGVPSRFNKFVERG